MNSLPVRVLGVICLTAMAMPALGNSVVLVPTSDTTFLADGDIVSFEIVADFSGDFATLGGGFDIVFDGAAVSFLSLNDAGVGDPVFSREPDVLENMLESWAIGAITGFNASDTVIGTVQFRILSTMGQTTRIQIRDTNGIGGHWVSALDNVSPLEPVYNKIDLNRGLAGTIFKNGFEGD